MQYAQIAKAIYKDELEMQQHLVANGCPDWAVRFWQAGTQANGFQGAILENDQEVICAFKGSKTGVTFKQDWLVSDVQIALNMIPNQTTSALEMVDVAKRYLSGNKPISIVGHSLGGGLAQLVGFILGIPFVSFNGPGMLNNLQSLPFHRLMRQVGRNTGTARGFNMILWTDPIGNFGAHIGKTERFLNRGPGIAHVMGAVLGTLQAKPKWANKTLQQLLA